MDLDPFESDVAVEEPPQSDKVRRALALIDQTDADAGKGPPPAKGPDGKPDLVGAAMNLIDRTDAESRATFPDLVFAAKERGKEGQTARDAARTVARLSTEPDDIAKRILALHKQFAGNPELTSKALAREGWDRSLITPRLMADIRQAMQEAQQPVLLPEGNEGEGIDPQQAQAMAQENQAKAQGLQNLLMQLEWEWEGGRLKASKGVPEIDTEPKPGPGIVERLGSWLKVVGSAYERTGGQPTGAGAPATIPQDTAKDKYEQTGEMPPGSMGQALPFGAPPNMGAGESLVKGVKQGFVREGPSLITGGPDAAMMMPPGQGASGFIGETAGGLVGGILNPKNLAENVVGYLTGAKAAMSAAPIIGKVGKAAGPRVAAAMEHAINGAAGSAPFSALNTAQGIPLSQWSEDPWGSLSQVLKAAGVAGAVGGGVGAVTGTVAGKPSTGGTKTIPELIGEPLGVKADPDAPYTITPETQAAARQAARDYAEAMGGPSLRHVGIGVPEIDSGGMAGRLIGSGVDTPQAITLSHDFLLREGAGPAEARAGASAVGVVYDAAGKAAALPDVAEYLGHATNHEQARIELAQTAEKVIARDMINPESAPAEPAVQAADPVAKPLGKEGDKAGPELGREVGVGVEGQGEKGTAKQPWEMTREEWVNSDPNAQSVEGLSFQEVNRLRYQQRDAHQAMLAQALSEGKPVPPEVLKDYPDLAAKAQPLPERIATEFIETAKKVDPEAFERMEAVKNAEDVPEPTPASKRGPAEIEYPEFKDSPDRLAAIAENERQALELEGKGEKLKEAAKKARIAVMERERAIESDPESIKIVEAKIKGLRGKARAAAKSSAERDLHRADPQWQKLYEKQTKAETATYAYSDEVSRLSDERTKLDSDRTEFAKDTEENLRHAFMGEVEKFPGGEIGGHLVELRGELDAITNRLEAIDAKFDPEERRIARGKGTREEVNSFEERRSAEQKPVLAEKARLERRIKAVQDAMERKQRSVDAAFEKGAEGDVLPPSYKPGEGTGKSFPDVSPGKLAKQTVELSEKAGAEIARLEKQSKAGSEHAISRALSPDELAEANMKPPHGIGVGQDIRKGLATLRAFIREVPEFAIDPRFVVTKEFGLRFQDGGRYTFYAPESLGIKFLQSLKPGESVKIDLSVLEKMKGGGEPKWLIAEPSSGTTPKSAIKAAGVEPEKASAPKGGGGGGVANPGTGPLPAPPGPQIYSTKRLAADPLPGGAKPVRDMVLKLTEGIGKVRAGKPEGRNLGNYYPGSSKSVIRFSGDLDTAAHEIAHRLDDMHGIVADWAFPKRYNKAGVGIPERSPFDAELGVGKKNLRKQEAFQQTIRDRYSLTEKRAEAVAEWIRAWMVNPTEAERLAPTFAAWFKKKVGSEHTEAMRSFGDDVRKWAGASNTERVLSNVELGTETKGIVQRVKDAFASEGVGGSWIDRLNAGINDSLAPVWKGVALAKELRGISDLLPEKDPIKRIRLFAGFDRKAMDVLEYGPITFKGDRVSGMGGLDWLLEPLKSDNRKTLEADFRDTIAFGLSERVVEKADLLDKAVKKLQELGDEAETLRQEIQNVEAGAGGTVMGSGVDRLIEIKKEIAQIRKNIGYNGPIDAAEGWARGKKERMAGFGAGIYSDLQTAQAALAELKSDPARLARISEAAKRYRQWGDALLDYMEDAGRISSEQRKAIKEANNYYFAMKRLMDDIDPDLFGGGAGRRIASVKQPIHKFSGSTRTIENPYASLIEQTYTMMKEADRNAALRTFTDLLRKDREMYRGKPIDFDQIGSIAKSGDPDTIRVFRKGEEVRWQFAPDIHKALKGWGINETPHFLLRALQAPVKMVRSLITLAPQFIIRQQLRDPLSRTVVSRSGSKPWSHLYFVTHPGEFAATLSEFERHGGGLFGYHGVGREAYYAKMRDTLHDVAGETTPIKTILSTPLHAMRGYKRLAELGEELGRLGEYRAAFAKAKAKGMDDYNAKIDAAYEARSIQDFAVAGTVTKAINQWIPFTSAAVRGMARSVEAAKGNPTGFAAKWLVYVASLEAMNYAWNAYHGHDEDVRNLSDYRRDLFWNFKLGDYAWLTIPKPYELGVMGSGVARAIDATRGKPDAFKGYMGSLWRAGSPVDINDLAGPYPGLVEVLANRNLFTGGPIVPDWERHTPVGQRGGEVDASAVGRLLGETMGVDARYIDRILISQGGGLGQLAVDAASDKGVAKVAMRASGLMTIQRQTDGFYKALRAAEERETATDATDDDRYRAKALRSIASELSKVKKAVRDGTITQDEGDEMIRGMVENATEFISEMALQ